MQEAKSERRAAVGVVDDDVGKPDQCDEPIGFVG
jgi:hypothetical protein